MRSQEQAVSWFFIGSRGDDETGIDTLGVSGITSPCFSELERSDVALTCKTHSST